MSPFAIAATIAYLLMGAAVSMSLARRGATLEERCTAVVGWVFFLATLSAPPPQEHRGPHADRIEHAFHALSQLLADADRGEADWERELDALHEALLAADQRVQLVDQLLAEEATAARSELHESRNALVARRTRAAEEIQGVLDELARLRLQIGLVALSGDALPIREGLLSLAARIRALDEVEQMPVGSALQR